MMAIAASATATHITTATTAMAITAIVALATVRPACTAGAPTPTTAALPPPP